MGIKSNITDKSTGISAEVCENWNGSTERKSLVVATRPLKYFENSVKFFTNDDYGIDINQDVSAGGTPEIVHDGIDLSKWTASDIVGGGESTFDNDDHAHEGIITVVDYSLIDAADSFTINTTTRAETDWTAETSNTVTATNIAADINTNVTGFSASSSAGVVTVTADSGYDITTFETNADAGEMTATGQSIKIDNSPLNDTFQFDKGSDLDCTGYVSITMWVYVDKDWKSGDSVELYGWDTGTGLQVGDAVGLEDYFNWGSFDEWNKITIPLTDMGVLASSTTLDALRVKQSTIEGKAPKYYIDSIQFEQTGTPVAFTLQPDKGTWLYVNEFTISIADALASTLENAGLPVLAYNKMLGETLVSGIDYSRTQNGEIKFTQTIKSIMDLLQLPNTEITAQGSDGTNTFVTIRAAHHYPIILKAEDDDILSWTISEDLSGLLQLRISAGCKEEKRT